MLLPTVAKFCKNPLRGFLKRGGGRRTTKWCDGGAKNVAPCGRKIL